MLPKLNLPIMVEEWHLMENVSEVLVMTLQFLQFLVLIIVHHPMLIVEKITF